MKTSALHALELRVYKTTHGDMSFFFRFQALHGRAEKQNMLPPVFNGSLPRTKQEEILYVKFLAHVMLTEPNVTFCCRQICNTCLSKPMNIYEAGKKVNAKFSQKLRYHFVKFCTDAIAMYYMCGFVAYYTEKRNGIRLPHTLPLGSFTWSVERISGDGRVWPFTVKVRGIDCSFDEHRIFIFSHDVHARNVIYSPMEEIMRLLTNYITIHNSITTSIRNNEKVNVIISEKIDIKDQTLNGIQMLDDARLYMMKGSTPLQQYDLGVRLSGTRTDTVNLEREHALRQTNEMQEKVQLTSIPPNSQVTALTSSATHTDVLKESYRQYVNACYAHFGIPVAQTNASGSQTESQQSNNCINVTLISQMVQQLLEQAYARCFELDADQVIVTLSNPKLEVRQLQDIKTLWECGIFSESEIKNLFS